MDNIRSFRRGRDKRFLKKNKWNLLTLGIILLIGSFYISLKEGYHMDELLSFELANAEFTPWIVTTQPEGRLEKFVKNEIYGESFGETWGNVTATIKDVIKNRGESKMLSYKADVYEEPVWISAEQFKAYITTEGHDRFNYLSVYFNVKDDNHPPLHFMALHTVSSLFAGQISPWMGCCINLILVIGICLLLMKICRELPEGEELGRAVCILYACSMGGLATLLLIRMYTMLTFFCVAALYLHLRKMRTGQWKDHNGLLIFVTVCGFLTQYFFVIFMLFLAGVTGVLLWKRQDRKSLLCYGRSMLISAVAGICIFPFSIEDVLYSGRGVESVRNLGSSFSSIGERLTNFLLILGKEPFGGIMGFGIFLLILTAAFVVWLFAKNREDAEAAAVRKKEREKKKKLNGDFISFYQMVGIPLLGYFLVVIKIAPFYADRYLMPIFPLISLLMGIALHKSLGFLGKYFGIFGKRGALYLMALCIVLPNLIMETPPYLYQGYRLQEEMAEEYADAPCLCVYDGVGYYENLPEFTHYEKTLLVTRQELLERSPDKVLAEESRLVVLFKNDSQKSVSGCLAEKYGLYPSKILMRRSPHGDMLLLYEKQKEKSILTTD